MSTRTENFDYQDAVKRGSKEVCYLYKLGETYHKKVQWFKKPVIKNGPYGARLVTLKLKSTPVELIAGKTYDMEFRVTFLREMSVEIEVISAQEV